MSSHKGEKGTPNPRLPDSTKIHLVFGKTRREAEEIPGCIVKILHPDWDEFLEDLAAQAYEYLGFRKEKLAISLHGLFMWEESSMCEITDAESELANHIISWALKIEAGRRENHPLMFVLDQVHQPTELSIDELSARGRARVLAARAAQSGKPSNYAHERLWNRVKYTAKTGMNLHGKPENKVE
ncbi:hypothetical protein VTI74DRAFT_4103 [Chaetomium olivicolor]